MQSLEWIFFNCSYTQRPPTELQHVRNCTNTAEGMTSVRKTLPCGSKRIRKSRYWQVKRIRRHWVSTGQRDKLWSQQGSIFPIASQKKDLKGTIRELCRCLQGGQEGENIKVLLWHMTCSHEPAGLSTMSKFSGSRLRNLCVGTSEREGCGMCCHIKGEAVEGVKRGGIWPKREVDRYVMKDVWFLLDMTSGTRRHLWRPERRWFQYARCEELRIGWEF